MGKSEIFIHVFPGDVVVGEAGPSKSVGEPWQRGCNAWGVRGLFPTSCVQELNLSCQSKQLSERSAQAHASDLPPYALGQARALMNLHAQLNEELDFREGDLIIITALPEPGWFEGELDGRRGIFPEGFVEVIGLLRSPQEPEECQYLHSDTQQLTYEDPYDAVEAPEESMEEGEDLLGEEEKQREDVAEEEGGIYGVALYNFRAMEPGELDFDVGDRIRVISTLEDGWLEGELRGRHGIFPHRFVKMENTENAEQTNAVETKEEKESSFASECSPGHLCPNGSDSGLYKDHTVWDLDYFERTEEKGVPSENTTQTNSRTPEREEAKRPDSQPHRPAAVEQKGQEQRKSIPPARPRLPPRPSPPSRSNQQHSPSLNTTQRSNYTNGDKRVLQPKRSHSLTLPHTQRGWSKSSRHYQRPAPDVGTRSNRGVSQELIHLIEDHKQKQLAPHANGRNNDVMTGSAYSPQTVHTSNGLTPKSFTFESLAAASTDLEAKLSQQLFEFEKSLTSSYSDACIRSVGDQSRQSHISRHYSILDFSSERDIIRGSAHSPVDDHVQSKSASSTLERRRSLRPPPPRPRALRPPAPASYKPARPAPRPPPRCPRQNTAPPTCHPATSTPMFYTPDESASHQTREGHAEFGDPASQEQDNQSQLEAENTQERERELENQKRREEEERSWLLLRLQEVEHDMDAYAHTAEELRAMLEEEEEETARMQAMENLEFCNYTLETLALEQQQLQGRTGRVKMECVYIHNIVFFNCVWLWSSFNCKKYFYKETLALHGSFLRQKTSRIKGKKNHNN